MYYITEEGHIAEFSFSIQIQLDWIEEWYPGFENLSPEEQAERDNYESLHEFQLEIAKRRQEEEFEDDLDDVGLGGNI